MKYYTPELLVRFGSEDYAVASQAEAQLEANGAECAAYLQEVGPRLPPRLVALQRICLHDARVLNLAAPWQGNAHWSAEAWKERLVAGHDFRGPEGRCPSFPLSLRLDPARQVLVLDYRGARIEAAEAHPVLFEHPACPLEWLYDEIELVEEGAVTEVRQAVLFTNGLELRLRFRDFDYAQLSPMDLPAEPALVAG